MPDKKRVAGTVDRVEGDIAVIVFKDPDSGEEGAEKAGEKDPHQARQKSVK